VSRISQKQPPRIDQKRTVVADISSHPKFREVINPSINPQVIARLIDLAGPEFLSEVIDEYLVDSKLILERLRQAVAASDVLGFRSQAHAMRSGAANLGATELYDLCCSWQTISADELAAMGPPHLKRLTAELGRVETALLNWDTKGVARR
jgi:two-component system, sensor histidine kinase RpfC